MKEEISLDGMPPIKKPRKKVVKKFHSNQNVPVDVAVRRQVAAEIGDDEPTKDQKFILLQKYGVTAPRIDRQVTKPNWMGVKEWKRKQNDWFQATKGLVKPQQRPKYRPTLNSQPRREFNKNPLVVKPWSQLNHKARPQGMREFRPNFGQTRTGNRQS